MDNYNETLRGSLEQFAQIFGSKHDAPYHTPQAFVLAHGKAYAPPAAGYDAGRYGADVQVPKQCFGNATLLARRCGALTYVEGYVMIEAAIGLPIHHAWCVDGAGAVVDPTIQTDAVAYYGVEFPIDDVIRLISKTGWNSMFSWPNGKRVLKKRKKEVPNA